MKLIAILPARWDSKRLPHKNFKEFFGKSIIKWVLEEIYKSEIFDTVIISHNFHSTPFANEEQNVVDYRRPKELYGDNVSVEEVCLDVLKHYPDYDYLCCIYPTAYAVTWEDLCQSFHNMLNEGAYAICSGDMLNYKRYNCEYIMDNGGFYWMAIEPFLKAKKFKTDLKYSLSMVDINTLQDFVEAKLHVQTFGDRFKRFNRQTS